jgi:phosphate transport system substrate-binding protein
MLAGCADDVLQDRVRIAGSETLRTYLSAASGAFLTENPSAEVRVDLTGTGDGLTRLCDGLVEVAAASRQMNDRERTACEQSGVNPVELPIALDAVAVVTAPGTGPTCLTPTQLYAATGPESTGVDDWAEAQALASQIDPATPDLPVADERAPLAVIAPRAGSGTVDTFVTFAVDPLAEDRGNSTELRADVTTSPSSSLTVSESVSRPADLGIVGYADLAGTTGAAKAVAISVDGACVAPNAETIAAGTYPIQRQLYLYLDREDAVTNPTAKALTDLILSDDGQALVEESGAVRITPEALGVARSAWATAQP